jgi:hypothetical protein
VSADRRADPDCGSGGRKCFFIDPHSAADPFGRERQPREFRELAANGIRADYTWTRPGADYLNIY